MGFFTKGAITDNHALNPNELLTRREMDVFARSAEDLPTQTTARKLNISTVGSHIENIKEKFGFSHYRDLAIFAVK